MGLRGRLSALVLVAMLPAGALIVAGAVRQRGAAVESSRSDLLRVALAARDAEETAVRDARLTLTLLADSLSIRRAAPEERAELLADVARQNPVYAVLGLIAADGSVRVSSQPVPRDVNLSDRAYYRKALATGGFVVGGYQTERITGRPSVNVAMPLRAAGGGEREILFAALDLARLQDRTSGVALPEGASLALLDGSGTVLARLPHRTGSLGRPLREDPDLGPMPAGSEGTLVAEDAAGARRILGYAGIRGEAGEAPVAYLQVALPERLVTAAADRVLVQHLLWFAGAVAAALAAAHLLGSRLLVRRVRRLREAADRLASGDVSVRILGSYGGGEVGGLERAFDRMADALDRERRERLETETALRGSEDMFRQMAESIDEVFWVSEPGPRPIRYVSPGFERVWGMPRDRLYAKPALWRESIHPSDRERVATAITRDEAAGRYDETYRIVRPDGSVRWVRDRAFPVKDEAGRVLRIFGIAEDMTRFRDLEHQAQQSQKMEAVGRLAAGVAHDFNNVLSVIQGYTELALEGAQGESRDQLVEVLRSAERAAALVRQLLTFSRGQVAEPRAVDLNFVLADMERMLRRLIGADVEMVSLPGRGLRGIYADPHQIEQVILNLAVNARDAMPAGGRLTLETYDVVVDETYAQGHLQARPGPYVVLAVTDSGVGMDDATRERIFEPFFTTKGEGKGTGLGLATVYGIVKQCGGDIFVYSEPGIGTTFKIYFPPHEGAAPAATGGVKARRAPGRARTVLLVEDDRSTRALVYAILRAGGHTVLAAGSAEEALRELEGFNKPVDVLLTDIGLPGMDGLTLAERVRKDRPGTRVLLISGYTEATAGREGGIPAWAQFIAKPFGPPEILRKIEEVCEGPDGAGLGAGPAAAGAAAPHEEFSSVDPAHCLHQRVRRLGLQEAPVAPFKLHLVLCLKCGTTLTTERLRHDGGRPRRSAAARTEPPSSLPSTMA